MKEIGANPARAMASWDSGHLRHIAIIMDGNGRWAYERSLPRLAGHRKGVDVVRQTVGALKGPA